MYAHELFETSKPRVVVTYPGRFQPFHQGHAGVFAQLQKKFGNENVFILTSNDQSTAKSPFNFSDKYQLITAAGVPGDKIIETTAMYTLPEGFDPANTILVTAVGSPDADRLRPDSVLKRDKKDAEGNIIKPAGSPSYYRTWGADQTPLTADQAGYVVVIPEIHKSIKIGNKEYDVSHGTECRNLWNAVRNKEKARAEFLTQLYNRPSAELAAIFDKIPDAANEDIAPASMDSTSPVHGVLNEFAPDDSGGSRKFIPWTEFIEQVKQIVSKDFSCKENVVKSTIKARFVPHDPMEYGPTMLYSYYETRAGGRNKGAVSTRGSIQVGKYTKGGLFGHTPDQLLTGFHLLKGHPFERHFDLTFDNIYKIANIIMGNTQGALEFKPEGVTEGWKEKVAGAAIGAAALGGIGALQNVAPNTTYQGHQFQLAMPGKIPPDAKLVTDDNGKKIYVWKTAGQKNRISWSYRPAEEIKEQGVAEGSAQNDAVLNYFAELLADELGYDADEVLDNVVQEMSTPSGIPVYTFTDDTQTYYMGVLGGNKGTPIVSTSHAGGGQDNELEIYGPGEQLKYVVKYGHNAATLHTPDNKVVAQAKPGQDEYSLVGIALDMLWGKMQHRFMEQGVAEAYDHNAPFNAADFNRHMEQLRAREELRKTDPMKALVGDLIDKEHEKEQLAKRKKPEDDSIGINDPRHPSYAYSQMGQTKIDEEFGSKQEVINYFVKQGKPAAAGAAAWERGWRGSKPKAKTTQAPNGPQQKYWWQDKDVNEDAAGVGVVAKNKKMAKDPRYSMSITQDVKPETPKNMLRAFRLSEDEQSEMKELLNKFLPIAQADLKLDEMPEIVLQPTIETHNGQATFGKFVNDDQKVYLALNNRHPVDILRTLAHELVHYKQHTLGKIKPDSGETGSPEENQAHSVAGIIMRHFNKEYPDAINAKAVAAAQLKEARELKQWLANMQRVKGKK